MFITILIYIIKIIHFKMKGNIKIEKAQKQDWNDTSATKLS